MRTAYRCRAYPDEAQQALLNRTFGCVRAVWNQTLAERHRLYHAEGKNFSYASSDAARRAGATQVLLPTKQETQRATAGLPCL